MTVGSAMQNSKNSKKLDAPPESPPVIQGDLILFAGDMCAVPGSFSLDGMSIGAALIALGFGGGEHDLIAQPVELKNGAAALIRRSLHFPMLNGSFVLWWARPELTIHCRGSRCGRSGNSWEPSSQYIIGFRFRAAFHDAGLYIELEGELEQTMGTVAVSTPTQPSPPTFFALSGAVPWSVLPYLFGKTPAFFEQRKQELLSSQRGS